MRISVLHRDIAVLALLPVLAFGASISFGFVDWDDPILITQNPWVHGLTWENIRHAFTSYDPELYVPLTLLSYQINFALAGLDPWIYHATNLLLHALNAMLAFVLAKRFISERGAWIAAALFAVHPLQTEAVVWAAARKDLLSGTLLLLSLILWFQWMERGGRGRYACSLLSFLCALLTKVSVLGLPLLLPFLPLGGVPGWNRRRAVAALPFLGLSVVFAIIAAFGKETVGHLYLEQSLIGALALMRLALSVVAPLHLAALYPYTQPLAATEPVIAWAMVGCAMLTALCLWLLRKSRWPLLGWAWFVVFVAPSFGNFAKGHDELLDVYVTSDRYAYVALLAPLLLLGWALGSGDLRRKVAYAAIVGCVLLSVRQALTWRDSETFWRHVVAVSPNAHVAHTNLGVLLVKRGDIDGGRRAFAASLAVRPNSLVYFNLGLLAEHDGDKEGALAAYRKSVAQSPLETDAWLRISAILEGRGDLEAAKAALRDGLDAVPGHRGLEATLRALQ